MSATGSRGFRMAAVVSAVVAFLPFLRMVVSGESLFFRDLAGQFFPGRRFLVEGLARGEVPFWNPFSHGGVPMVLLPFAYPLELLQLAMPTEAGFSLFLALHVPLAAVGFAYLCRELDLTPIGAVMGALTYALGGFSLSTINLYHYALATAWAPAFVMVFRRAVNGGERRVMALAALVLATLISTTGFEVALQACLIAAALTPPGTLIRLGRSSAVAMLGLGLTGALVIPFLFAVGQTERGAGFSSDIVLTNSLHPVAFLQTILAGLFGNIANLVSQWWGVKFFPRGFPYILSLFVGPIAMASAACGLLTRHPLRFRLLALAACAALVCLGSHTFAGEILASVPVLRSLRYPVKAFFTLHFCVALLAGISVSEISRSREDLARQAALVTGILAVFLLAFPVLPAVAPALTQGLLAWFLPPNLSDRAPWVARFVAADAAGSGIMALLAALLLLLAAKGRLPLQRCAALVTLLAAADLLRAGAGLNPSVTSAFYTPSPELQREIAAMRASGGRTFSCDVEASPSYWQTKRRAGENGDVFAMATLQETLTPDFNVGLGVRTAMSMDRASLVPQDRVLSVDLASCQDLAAIIPALQNAGVTRVMSLEPLSHPSLHLVSEFSPARIAPVMLRVYALGGARPRFDPPAKVLRDTPDHLEIVLESAGAGSITVGEPFAPGWSASVNGRPRPILRGDEGNRRIAIDAGHNDVAMVYEPPGLRLGVGVSFAAAVVIVLSLFRRSPNRGRPGPETSS